MRDSASFIFLNVLFRFLKFECLGYPLVVNPFCPSPSDMFNLREFVVNSRHPSPRRVLGRCRAAVRGPDPRDPGDPGDPRDPGESGDGIIFARFRYVLQ